MVYISLSCTFVNQKHGWFMLPDFMREIFAKVSPDEINVLFLLGMALFVGTLGGRLFQRFRAPQVIAYILIGVLIGKTGFDIVDDKTIATLEPFSYFALGILGFLIGGELRKDVLEKYGAQMMKILFYEAITPFVVVTVLVGVLGTFLFGNAKIGWSLGMILGAIASASAPATTTDVLWENRTKGPLTRTVLGIVALDDALALVLFAFATTIAASLLGITGITFAAAIIKPIYDILLALVIGLVSGIVLSKILDKFVDEEKILAFSLGMILLVLGLSIALDANMLLAAMLFGVVLTNYAPRKSREIFRLVKKFDPPIFVLFFVLVGAKLNIYTATGAIWFLIIAYILARTIGKIFGSHFGAKIARAPKTVQRYLPLCLFSQAGVAIGFSVLVGQHFPGVIGDAVVIIITVTTFFLQLIAPIFVRQAVHKAGEVGLDVTEEDLIAESKVEDAMAVDFPRINEQMTVTQLLGLIGDVDSLDYPVVTEEGTLSGMITIESIKSSFSATELTPYLLAHDLMDKVIATTKPDIHLTEAIELMKRRGVEFLPVLEDSGIVIGVLENRGIQKHISQKMLELERKAQQLESIS